MGATLVKTKYAGIYEKGNRYQVRYRHHGRQAAKSFRTLTEARRFKGKVDAGEAQPTSRQPFAAYADDWIESYSGRTSTGVSETTRAAYRDALDRFAKPFFGTRPLERIGPKLVREYIAHLEAQGLTPSSVRKYYAPVRSLLATAAADELIVRNPASDVRVTTADSRPKMPKWLTVEQTKALLEEIPEQYADLMYVLATTGLRISEALNLRWQDLAGAQMTITQSKTAAGKRTITITPETMRRLTKRRGEQILLAARHGGDQGFVFPARNGTRMDPRNFRHKVFNPAAERVGVPWATPHKLRHGVASIMAAEGLGAPEIAAFLGHADGGVLALRTYIHSAPIAVDFIDGKLKD